LIEIETQLRQHRADAQAMPAEDGADQVVVVLRPEEGKVALCFLDLRRGGQRSAEHADSLERTTTEQR
jgi:hypothetical protein